MLKIPFRVFSSYTLAGEDSPILFATESLFCDELSATSYSITDPGRFLPIDENFGGIQTA